MSLNIGNKGIIIFKQVSFLISARLFFFLMKPQPNFWHLLYTATNTPFYAVCRPGLTQQICDGSLPLVPLWAHLQVAAGKAGGFPLNTS